MRMNRKNTVTAGATRRPRVEPLMGLGAIVTEREILALGRGGAEALLAMMGGDFPIEIEIPKEVEWGERVGVAFAIPREQPALPGHTQVGRTLRGRSKPPEAKEAATLDPQHGHSGRANGPKEPPRSKSGLT